MLKKCTKCKKHKKIEDFGKTKDNKLGKKSMCKLCINLRNKNYRLKKLEHFKSKRKEHYQKNREKMLIQKNKYASKHKQEKALYDKIYREKNKEKIKEHKKNWIKKHSNCPILKIKRNLRRRIHHLIADDYKSMSTFELVGCSAEEFKNYMELKFIDGMNWENYGQWHIDHIRPCSSFDLTDIEQQKICFHYSNCQPLWAIDNLKKGKKL